MRIVQRFVYLLAECDEWIKELAPSVELLIDYRYHNLAWEDYEARYREEMKAPEILEILNKRT